MLTLIATLVLAPVQEKTCPKCMPGKVYLNALKECPTHKTGLTDVPKTTEGYKKAPNGLVTWDLKAGEGSGVAAGDYVTVQYTGSLLDGKVFDTSKRPGAKPFSFIVGVGSVIKGWDQGLVGMKPGGTRALVIPSELGYGTRGAGELIPPNAPLNFVVELLAIQKITVKTDMEGTGEGAKAGDTVLVHYRGKLTDGKQFDASYDRGEPMRVVVGRTGLIPGFTMGLLGLKKGEKRTITIPPALAYGENGAGNVIPGNATLVFEIEGVEISK